MTTAQKVGTIGKGLGRGLAGYSSADDIAKILEEMAPLSPGMPELDTSGTSLPAGAAQAGKLLMPGVPNPEVMRDAMHRAALVDVAQGAFSTPLTPYAAKLGHRAGQVVDSPLWRGARETAMLPAQMEQSRVTHDNASRDVLNKYLMAQSDFSNKRLGIATDRADQKARAEAAQQEQTFLGSQNDLERQNRLDVAKYTHGPESLALYLEKVRQAGKIKDDISKVKEDRGHARKVDDKAVDERGVKHGDMPTEGEIRLYNNIAAGLKGVDSMKTLLGEHPELTGPEGLSKAWGQVRVSAGPDAQRFASLNEWIHEQILQEAKRQGTKMGGSLAKALLPHVGDNIDVANMGLDDMSGYMRGIHGALRGARPKYNWDTNKPADGFTLTPHGDRRAGKLQLPGDAAEAAPNLGVAPMPTKEQNEAARPSGGKPDQAKIDKAKKILANPDKLKPEHVAWANKIMAAAGGQ